MSLLEKTYPYQWSCQNQTYLFQKEGQDRYSLAIAVDPDGQDVYIVDAELVGGQINNFSIDVSADSRTLSATHTVEGEFLMGAEVG